MSPTGISIMRQTPVPGHGWPAPVPTLFARGRSRSGSAGRREPHERAAGSGERINLLVPIRAIVAGRLAAGAEGTQRRVHEEDALERLRQRVVALPPRLELGVL